MVQENTDLANIILTNERKLTSGFRGSMLKMIKFTKQYKQSEHYKMSKTRNATPQNKLIPIKPKLA